MCIDGEYMIYTYIYACENNMLDKKKTFHNGMVMVLLIDRWIERVRDLQELERERIEGVAKRNIDIQAHVQRGVLTLYDNRCHIINLSYTKSSSSTSYHVATTTSS